MKDEEKPAGWRRAGSRPNEKKLPNPTHTRNLKQRARSVSCPSKPSAPM